MINITRWAGKHPYLVRFVLLPILFYSQGRLGFATGAHLFFGGITLSPYWLWGMMAVLWMITFIYPNNARALLYTAYWRIKGLEWIACTAAFALWVYAGNQMAGQIQTDLANIEPAMPMRSVAMAGLAFSATRSEVRPSETSEVRPSETEIKSENTLRKAYRSYFKKAIKRIRRTHRSQTMPLALGILLGVLGIGLGIVVLVCGIQCGGMGGAVALGVIGGLAFAGLGIWALIAGLRPKGSAALKE